MDALVDQGSRDHLAGDPGILRTRVPIHVLADLESGVEDPDPIEQGPSGHQGFHDPSRVFTSEELRPEACGHGIAALEKEAHVRVREGQVGPFGHPGDVGRELAADPEYAAKIVSAPAFVRVENIDASGAALHVSGTVRPGSQLEIAGVLRTRLLEAFLREGIKTPWG